MKVAVAGCGYWGSKHVRVLSGIPEVEQIVAVDPRDEPVLALRRTFPNLMGARDLESALPHVDAVVIATPPRTHKALASQAIAAGRHVLVEKPLATSTEDARSLIHEASAQGVTLMVGHTFEFNAAVWRLRDLVVSHELGRVYYLDSARLNLGLYQSDVNVVWDLAPHDISIFNYVLDSTPISVQAWGSRHANESLEDVAYLRLLYRGPGLDITANIHVSWLDPCKVRRVTVVGSSKMAVYNDLSTEERIRVFDKGVVAPAGGTALPDMPMSYRYGEIRSPHIPFDEPLSVQDRHFASCAMSGETPRTDGANGLAVVQVLECAEISLREGRPVRPDELFLPEREPQLTVAS